MQTAELLVQQELKKFSVTDAAIDKLKKEYLPLMINGPEDKESYQVVHSALKEVRSLRTSVEQKRKELNELPLAWQRSINAEAKRITNLITPIEDHLKSQKASVDEEKERQKEEAARKLQEKINSRISTLVSIGFLFNGQAYLLGDTTISPSHIKVMNDDQFEDFRAQAVVTFNQIQKEKKEEEARMKAEKERLEKEKAQIEARAKELLEKERELLRKQAEIEAEEERKAEKARKEEEERVRKKKEEEQAILREQLKPERDQVADWINSITLPKLNLQSGRAEIIIDNAQDRLFDMKNELQTLLNKVYYGNAE